MMTFETFLGMEEIETPIMRSMLIQAIAIISSHPQFQRMAPDEIFDSVARQAECIKRMEESR